MINKLLCFMWGHVWFPGFYIKMFGRRPMPDYWTPSTPIRCKHCGAVKK